MENSKHRETCRLQIESASISEEQAILSVRIISGSLRTVAYCVSKITSSENDISKELTKVRYSVKKIKAYGYSFTCLDEGMTATVHLSMKDRKDIDTRLFAELPVTLQFYLLEDLVY